MPHFPKKNKFADKLFVKYKFKKMNTTFSSHHCRFQGQAPYATDKK